MLDHSRVLPVFAVVSTLPPLFARPPAMQVLPLASIDDVKHLTMTLVTHNVIVLRLFLQLSLPLKMVQLMPTAGNMSETCF